MTAILCTRDGDTVYLACDSRVVCGDYFFNTDDKVRKYAIGDRKFYLGMAGHDPTIARIDAALDHPGELDPYPQCARDVARWVSDAMVSAQKKAKHGVDAILVAAGEDGPEVYMLGSDGSLSGPVTPAGGGIVKGPHSGTALLGAVGSGGQAALAAFTAQFMSGDLQFRSIAAINAAALFNIEVGGTARCHVIRLEDL